MVSSQGGKRSSFTAGALPRVASCGKKAIARAIVAWFLKNGGYPRSAKEVAKGIGAKGRTVRWHMEKLASSGVVESPVRGLYQLKLGSPDITKDPSGKLGLHGIVIKVPDLPEGPQGGPVGRVRGWKQFGELWKAYEEFEGRTVRLHYHSRTRTLLVYMEASRLPLELEEVKEYRLWLKFLLHPVDPDVRGYLVQVGINKDYWNWRLDGVKGVRFAKWVNAYEAIYQKTERSIRHEVHLTLTDMRLLDALKLIDGNSPTRMLLDAVDREAHKEDGPKRFPELGGDGYQTGYG